MKAIPLAILCVSAACAAPALAQSGEQRFQALDRDASRSLSLGEFAAESRAWFDAMDLDHDGRLTVAELDKAGPQRDGEATAAQRIARQDGNGDGELVVAELADRVEQAFAAIDSDGDGWIALAELKAQPMVSLAGL